MTVYIGPIELPRHFGNFTPTRDASPTDQGLLGGRISGAMKKPVAEQVEELVNNPDRRITVAGRTGVLEPLWIQNRPEWQTWHLLGRFTYSSEPNQQLHELVSFDLVCWMVPGQVIVTHSARSRGNDFGLTGESLLVAPFGGGWLQSPGGTEFSREVDPRTTPDVSAPESESRDLLLVANPSGSVFVPEVPL